jgi:hypothetical protein
LDAGHSLSFYERMWLHSWFAGAAMVTPENSMGIFFESPHAPWNLTPHGEKATEVFAFMRAHDRGVPYTPVALVLDHLAGYNAYQGRPWGILEKTAGDQETYDLLEQQIFPGSDHIHVKPDPSNPEASYLRPTPYGEMFDVLLSTAAADVLSCYPAILVVGDVTFDPDLVGKLLAAVKAGSQLLLHERHVRALGSDLARLSDSGQVEIRTPWTNPATGRPTAISHERLTRLVADLSPVAVEGDLIQYQVNRTRRGWVVELVNNAGVSKQPDQPAAVDPQRIARVTLRPRMPIQSATEWRSGRTLAADQPLQLMIPPGRSAYVELITQD